MVMDLRFTEEQQMMRDMVRNFAKTEIEPYIPRMEAGEFPREILKKMGGLGLMGITVPEEYGGAGMDFVSYISAIHELSKVSAVVGVILSVHTSVGTNPIMYFGNDDQKKRYLPKVGERRIPRCILPNRSVIRLGCWFAEDTCSEKRGSLRVERL